MWTFLIAPGWALMSTKSACGAINARRGRGKSRRETSGLGLRMRQENIGIAVVGAGRIGTLRARLAAKHPAVEFLAISDRDPARARARGEQAGADVQSGSKEEVIAHPGVTAVIVSTPEQQHTQPILKALELGKPVLVEKPIGFSLREADKILDTLRATKGEL